MTQGRVPLGFDRLCAWLRETASRMCSDVRVCEAAIDETVSAFLDALARGEISHAGGWLHEALRRRILKHRRRLGGLVSLDEADVAMGACAMPPAGAHEPDVDLDCVLRQICQDARLTHRQSEAVMARWKTRSVVDAAAYCGRTVRDTRSALTEAEKKMRAALARHDRQRTDGAP